MGALIRAHDWASTPLGDPHGWPQPLKTAVGLLLNSGYPMYVAWGDAFTQIYNDAYRPILGATKHPAALGIGTPETFAEIWDYIGPMFRSVLESGQASTYVDQLLPMNRYGFTEECYFVFSYSPVLEEAGHVGGVFVTVLETTERVLRDRRQNKLRQLLEGSTDLDPSEVIDAALGRLAEDCPDVAYARQLPEDGLTPYPEAEPFDISAPLQRGLGPEPVTRAVRLPLVAPGALHPTCLIEFGLSPRLAWDEAYATFLHTALANIGTLVAKADALSHERRRAEELARIDAAKTVFFSNVSHEFRTPLTLMLGPLRDLLNRTDLVTPEGRGLVEVADRNAERLLKLVNALLDFSRIEAGRVTAHFEPADLGALTADLASNFRSAVEAGGVQLIVDCPPLAEPVAVDRDMWEKIVLNLVSNAFKFTMAGHIAVRLHATALDTVILSVEDTGEGIPEAEVPRLFERFHRIEGARSRSHEGTGIGLALVQELVHLHGGHIEVASAPGEGTTFTVTLPLRGRQVDSRPADTLVPSRQSLRTQAFVNEARSWVAEETGAASLIPEGETITTSQERGRVLVADDNADMRRYIGDLFRASGLDVLLAADGVEALDAAAHAQPDVVVSDVMMPRLDGLGMLARLRADPALAATPVILVTARAGEDETIAGVGAGADDYVAKPFAARELLARVQSQLALRRLRREAGAAIEASERRMRLAQAAGRIATWEYNPASGGFDAPATKSLWGIDPALGYAGFLEAIHPEDRPNFKRAVRDACRADGLLELEIRIVRPDTGAMGWIACRAEFQPTGSTGACLMGISFDITEQRKAEDALRRMNSTLEAEVAKKIADRDRLWKLSTDVMLVARFDGTIHDVNPAWTTLLHWQREELIGENFLGFVHPDDIDPTRAEMSALSDGRVTFKFENRYRSKSGSYRWLTWTATPDQDFIHAVGRDITDEKLNAERLETAEAALRQAQKMDAIGQLSGGIAHDFNNLLGAIVGSLDLIRRRPDDTSKVMRLADTGLKAAGRGALLTGQLLTFSRAQRIDMRPTDVGGLVTGMHDLIVRTLGPSINVRTEVQERKMVTRSDATQLEMAILNLAINARDAMPDGGNLAIRVASEDFAQDAELRPGRYIIIDVADTGTGMPPEVAARALDPFFTTKGVGKGTGLGLSQAFGFAKQSGGTLRILTRVGHGTRVQVILPEVDQTPEERVEEKRESETGFLQSKRVLVVDDDAEGRSTICELLTALELTCLPAGDGLEALRVLDGEPVDVVLLDYAMPGMTGSEVADRIRAQHPNLPIIFISGYADTAAIEAASDEKTRMLRKPFGLVDLQIQLQQALGSSETLN